MSKKLVAYFSASGVTKKTAEKIASSAKADIFEIVPEQLYTDNDLDWQNSQSRSSVEMQDKSSRPPISSKIEKIDEYDAILLGFPIWWYVAPTIVNTFLESYNFSGKKIALFATSGMSGMGNTTSELKKSSPNAVFIAEKRFASSASQEEIEKWLNDLDI